MLHGLRAKVCHRWLLRKNQWEREEEEEGWAWCGIPPPSVGGSCSSQQQERILQHFLGSFPSSPATDIPCLRWLLPAEFPLGAEDPAAHVSHFTLAGTEQQELQKLQVTKKRAADSLGVFLGTRILVEISPAPKLCAHTIKIAIKALQVHQFVWVTEEPEQQIQPQHLPWATSCCSQCPEQAAFHIPGFMGGKRWQQDGPAQTPIPHLFVTHLQSPPAFLGLPKEGNTTTLSEIKAQTSVGKIQFQQKISLGCYLKATE